MSFDECVGFPHTRKYVEESVERTLRWAKRGKDVHSNENQSLFGNSTIKQSTKVSKVGDFPGSPVIKTSRFHFRSFRFNPYSGN